VKLARVTLKGAASAGPLESLLNVELSPALEQFALEPREGRPANPTIPPNCVVLPQGEFRRRITFAQTDTDFRVGSEVVAADGHSIDDPSAADQPHTIVPQVFSHAQPPEAVRHVCPRFKTTEVWELVNTTTEMHNFHIHQSKFRLADSHDPGAPPGLTVQTAWRDPGGVMTSQIPELETIRPVNKVDVWHDTIPVPPRDSKTGTPGVVYVAVPFRAREQIGTFVYHCHILEHEDGGMMAAVQVFDPMQWSALPASIRAASRQGPADFCGTPPPDYTPITYQPGIMDSLTSLLRRSGLSR
jgi:hypothetical protein